MTVGKSPCRRSDRCDHNCGGGGGVKADGAAIYFDHTLLAVAFAKQLQLATGKQAQISHSGTGPSISVDRTDTKTSVAAGLGKRGT